VKCSRGDQQIELTISGISLLETAGEDFDREAAQLLARDRCAIDAIDSPSSTARIS
jgi:hypothetical protein